MIYFMAGIAVLSLAFAAKCYIELWRWARMCQSAQIAIAYKQKVKLSAPLVEWLLWCNHLTKDDSNGRVVYRLGGTSVAIVKGRVAPRKTLRALALGRKRRKRTKAPPVRARQGIWSARDDTPKERKNVKV